MRGDFLSISRTAIGRKSRIIEETVKIKEISQFTRSAARHVHVFTSVFDCSAANCEKLALRNRFGSRSRGLLLSALANLDATYNSHLTCIRHSPEMSRRAFPISPFTTLAKQHSSAASTVRLASKLNYDSNAASRKDCALSSS